jgi:hypothetical protein
MTEMELNLKDRERSAGEVDLRRLKDRIDFILNNVLCDMKPGWDDSIEGFNKAWNIVRDILDEEIGRKIALGLLEDARLGRGDFAGNGA